MENWDFWNTYAALPNFSQFTRVWKLGFLKPLAFIFGQTVQSLSMTCGVGEEEPIYD